MKHRRDYVDLHRTTERERDNIEHEVSYTFTRCVVARFDLLFLFRWLCM